jgi:hypothetical protein
MEEENVSLLWLLASFAFLIFVVPVVKFYDCLRGR